MKNFSQSLIVVLFLTFLGCGGDSGPVAGGTGGTSTTAKSLALSTSSSVLAVGNSATLTASGGSGTYTYSIQGKAGTLSGNSIMANLTGTVVAQVSDGVNSATQTITIKGPSSIYSTGAGTCGTINGVMQCWGFDYDDALFSSPQATGEGHVSPGIATVFGGSSVVSLSGYNVLGTTGRQGYHICWISSSLNHLYCIGTNIHDMIDTTATGWYNSAQLISTVGTPTQVVTGQNFSCYLNSAQNVYCWGGGAYGTLGNNAQADTATPVLVSTVTGFTSITAGLDFACGVVNSGKVYCWGDMSNLILPGASVSNCGGIPCALVPTQLANFANGVTSISAGVAHLLVVQSGAAYTVGSGQNGTLLDGNSAYHQTSTPIAVGGLLGSGVTKAIAGDYISCFMISDLLKCGGLFTGPDTVYSTATSPADSFFAAGLSQVVVGNAHVCGMNAVNEVKCIGNNADYALSSASLVSSQVGVVVSNWQ